MTTSAKKVSAATKKKQKTVEVKVEPKTDGPKVSQWQLLLQNADLTDEELEAFENEYVIPAEVVYDPKVEQEKSARRKMAALAVQQHATSAAMKRLGLYNAPVLEEFFPSPESILAASDRLKKDASLLRQVRGKHDKTHHQLDRMADFLLLWHKSVLVEVKSSKAAVGYTEEVDPEVMPE